MDGPIIALSKFSEAALENAYKELMRLNLKTACTDFEFGTCLDSKNYRNECLQCPKTWQRRYSPYFPFFLLMEILETVVAIENRVPIYPIEGLRLTIVNHIMRYRIIEKRAAEEKAMKKK